MTTWITEADLARLHEREWTWARRQRYVLYDPARDHRNPLARYMVRYVRDKLTERGHIVAGMRHKAAFDLCDQGVRIEVKVSRWDDRENRYEVNLRDNDADVLVFGCLDGDLHCFVIPFDQVAGKTVIKITSHDPVDYMGQWMRWYEAWDVIDELVAAGRNAWQPELLEMVQ